MFPSQMFLFFISEIKSVVLVISSCRNWKKSLFLNLNYTIPTDLGYMQFCFFSLSHVLLQCCGIHVEWASSFYSPCYSRTQKDFSSVFLDLKELSSAHHVIFSLLAFNSTSVISSKKDWPLHEPTGFLHIKKAY